MRYNISMEQKPASDKKILVIEDDRFIGEMYIRSLKSEGYAIDWMTDGDAGLRAALTDQYNLILLDIMLPEKMGTEILQEIRKERPPISGSVIIMTNFEQDEDSRIAMEAQVDAYLIKADITPRRLVEIVHQVLD